MASSNTLTEVGSQYSTPVGFVYVFNLIVGAGVLALPKAFGDVGWVLGTVLLFILAIASYITATFMVEAMAAANALLRLRARGQPDEKSRLLPSDTLQKAHTFNDHDPMGFADESGQAGGDLFEIRERVEMGTMAKLFFNKVGVVLYYVCICIYLYGDLAIYAVAVPKALVNVTCGAPPSGALPNPNTSNTSDYVFDRDFSMYGEGYSLDDDYIVESSEGRHNHSSDDRFCFGHYTDHQVYWIYLAVFTVIVGPFTFFDVQKTKVLQILTTLLRYTAFFAMVILAIIQIHRRHGTHLPAAAHINGVPNMFGVAVYSFMCQHSLPSLITPMRNKSSLSAMFAGDFLLIFIFYFMVAFTAALAFPVGSLQDEYSNQFGTAIAPVGFSYFLRLFPVFVLSTNFPIISITLRNNLKALFLKPDREYSFFIRRIVFPVAALAPPVAIAFATRNLTLLVGYTGSYAGAGVQYVIPAALVLCARRYLPTLTGTAYTNKHRSPFRGLLWVGAIFVWTLICVCFVTVNHIMNH